MPGAESTPRAPRSLARQYRRWLIAVLLGVQALTLGATLVFVMWPMAQRSADDLAGLMMLSAQTWTELPPETRPAFEAELLQAHQLALRPYLPAPADTGLMHGFYVGFLERALAQRIGHAVYLKAEVDAQGRTWLWTALPLSEGTLGVGTPSGRMQTRPLALLLAVFSVGAVLALFVAWRLARHIAGPVARLDRAAAAMAAGTRPSPLAEEGPLELARLAHHFNDMAHQVQELLEARTTLFAGLSHDLRTPLARMRLALEMLTLRPTDATLIARLEQDIEVMNTLIGELLALARGLDREVRGSVNVTEWLQTRAAQHREAAVNAGCVLRVEGPVGLCLPLPETSLGRIVDNLLGNAMRYAPGEIELVVRSTATDGGVQHHIGVLDRGPGIPPEQREAMWQPFQRGEPSRSRATGGVGLGLAIVRQLARAQGWHVRLEGRTGGGLEAWVDLGPTAPVPCENPPAL